MPWILPGPTGAEAEAAMPEISRVAMESWSDLIIIRAERYAVAQIAQVTSDGIRYFLLVSVKPLVATVLNVSDQLVALIIHAFHHSN